MQKYLHLTLYVSLMLFCSCDFEADDIFTDDRTEPVELYDYYIDEYGNEGIVVYAPSSGNKYIVISCDESMESWGPMDEQVYATGDSVKSSDLSSASYGVAMHQAMKARGINQYPAQAWCDCKNQDEEYPRAGSWRLPTYYEWRTIVGSSGRNVSGINQALTNIGGTLLNQDNMYWTCDEDYSGHIKINNVASDYDSKNRAVITSPMRTTYSTKERWMKKNRHCVRAIKYIYYEN